MNEYSLFFSKRAKRELSKIDKPIRHTILSWLEKMSKEQQTQDFTERH